MDGERAQDIPPRVADLPAPQVKLSGRQVIGLVVLALLPAVALLGLTEKPGRLERSSGPLHVELGWEAVSRLYLPGLLQLTVSSTGSEPLKDVSVAVPLGWLEGFSDVAGVPAAEDTAEGQLHFPLGEVAAGGSRSLRLELRPVDAGLWRGVITVSHTGGAEQFAISTLTLP